MNLLLFLVFADKCIDFGFECDKFIISILSIDLSNILSILALMFLKFFPIKLVNNRSYKNNINSLKFAVNGNQSG